jgi:hypothetical protein
MQYKVCRGGHLVSFQNGFDVELAIRHTAVDSPITARGQILMRLRFDRDISGNDKIKRAELSTCPFNHRPQRETATRRHIGRPVRPPAAAILLGR